MRFDELSEGPRLRRGWFGAARDSGLAGWRIHRAFSDVSELAIAHTVRQLTDAVYAPPRAKEVVTREELIANGQESSS